MTIRTASLAILLAAVPLAAADAATPPAPLVPKMMGGPALQPAAVLSALLDELHARRALAGLDNEHRFVVASQHPGAGDTQVLRVNHTYRGVRVFGSQSVIVASKQGKLISESVADRRELLGQSGDGKPAFSVKPAITPQQAIDTAIKSVSRGGVAVVPPSAELIIYPIIKTERVPSAVNKAEEELNALDVNDVVDRYELAYQVRTRMRAARQPVFHDTIVNAIDGRIIEQWSMLQTVIGVGKSQYNGEVPLSTTRTASNSR